MLGATVLGTVTFSPANPSKPGAIVTLFGETVKIGPEGEEEPLKLTVPLNMFSSVTIRDPDRSMSPFET